MHDRQRYLETLLFGKPDRIAFSPGGLRESTLAAWHEQGLPEDTLGTSMSALRSVSSRRTLLPDRAYGFRHTMIPEFVEKVIEEREETRIVQDWKCYISENSLPG